MDAFLKRAQKPVADVEMKDSAHLMQEATKKPKYVPWIEK